MGLRQRAVLLLQFLEQPHVLDGDDGLVGEGLEQLDLLRRERTGGSPTSTGGDGADRTSLSEHRHHQQASKADNSCK
jgi:hypothetical protein